MNKNTSSKFIVAGVITLVGVVISMPWLMYYLYNTTSFSSSTVINSLLWGGLVTIYGIVSFIPDGPSYSATPQDQDIRRIRFAEEQRLYRETRNEK